MLLLLIIIIEIMFRNIYLQSYKNSTQNNAGVEMLLTHFNHVYSTLGSILNDIEFAFGKLVLKPKQQPTGSQSSKQEYQKQIEQVNKQIDVYKSPNRVSISSGIHQESKKGKVNFDDLANQVASHKKPYEKPALSTGEFHQLFHRVPEVQSKPKGQPNKSESQRPQQKESSPSEDFFDNIFNARKNGYT